MADINDINAAQTVKIVGSDATGIEQTPVQSTSTGALKTAINDQNGDPYTVRNPLPVTGSFDKFFSLVNNSSWMKLATYDRIVPSFSGVNNEIMTLDYYESGNVIGQAIIEFNSETNWEVNLTRYLLDDDGGNLLDDDGTSLFLD